MKRRVSRTEHVAYAPQADRHGVDERDWLIATMYFPSDERLRRSFAVAQAATGLLNEASAERVAKKKGDERILITRALLQNLIDAPDYASIREASVESVKQGTVAGDCLVTIYVTAMFPDKLGEPSLRKAFHVARWFAGRSRYGDGSRMSTRDATIREYWDNCRPVAHLWGALRLLHAFPRTFTREELRKGLTTPEGVRELYGVAQTLGNFGCNFIPKRARPAVPLLDRARIYNAPEGIEPLSLNLKRPPESLLEALRSYKAPRSAD